MKKRVLALLLSAVMVIGLLPTAAFAVEDTATLVSKALETVNQKTAEDVAMKQAGEDFRKEMETALKTPGETALEALKSEMEAGAEKWDGTAGAEGTDYVYNESDSTLTVKTAAGLAWMAQQMNSGNLLDVDVVLDADIDLSGKLWTPVKMFHGTFDGKGHKIKNLTINNEAFETRLSDLGLFQNIEGTEQSRSAVKNVTFENGAVYAPKYLDTNTSGWSATTYPYFGFAAGCSDFTDYENITVTGSLVLYVDGGAAGIVDDASANNTRGNSIKSCKVENATAYVSGDFFGMTYHTANAPVVENCSVSGDFYTHDSFYGITGEAEYGAQIKNCSVNGTIYSGTSIYGISDEIGENEYLAGDENGQNLLSGCTVNLNACTESSFYGLADEVADDSRITDCAVSGSFYAAGYFAGLVYDLYGGTVQNCTVTGTVYADDGSGAVYEASDYTDNGILLTNVQVELTARYKNTGGDSSGLVYI